MGFDYEYNDFEIRPCMLITENRCEGFGQICCQSIEEKLAFNRYIDENHLSDDLKFVINVKWEF